MVLLESAVFRNVAVDFPGGGVGFDLLDLTQRTPYRDVTRKNNSNVVTACPKGSFLYLVIYRASIPSVPIVFQDVG